MHLFKSADTASGAAAGFTVQLIRTQYEPNLLLQPAAGDPAADSSIAGVAVATASKVGQSAATKAPAGGKQPGAAQSIPATAAGMCVQCVSSKSYFETVVV